MYDKARLERKLGDYGTLPASGLEDGTILQMVQTYRRLSGARMMALDKAGVEKKFPSGEFHVSKKVDGEFSVIVFRDGEAITINPGGTVRVGLPSLIEAGELLKKAGVKDALIAAELFVSKPDGERTRVHDVTRIARRPESQEDLDKLHLAVFDIIEIDGAEVGEGFPGVCEKLGEIFGDGKSVRPVEAESAKDAKGVLALFEKWVEEGNEEGLVARSDTAGSFKIKPRHTFDFVVIGFAEGVDDRAGMLHDMLLAVMRSDGSYHVVGRVGGGFSEDERRDLLSDLRDIVVGSEYAEVNSDRVAYEMVRPEWVVEISCLDLVSQTTRGASIDRMVLSYDNKEDMWKTVRRLPLVSIVSPQFVRRRTDKQAVAEDVRISQLTDFVEIEKTEVTAEDLELPKSEVLRKEVVVKELKGKTMVRKLLMWRTNKDDKADFPAFVVHLTDFSPNRKDPLKREIRVSDSQEQIQELYDGLKKKFFVGGWKEPEPIAED